MGVNDSMSRVARRARLILLLAGACAWPCLAQSPSPGAAEVQLEVSTSEPVAGAVQPASPEAQAARTAAAAELGQFLVVQENTAGIARLTVADNLPLLTFADGRVVRLPLQLETSVSRDGRTVLQFGDNLMRMHPVRADLFWIDARGAIAAQVRNRYDGTVRLDLSDDGFTAIAAAGYFESHARAQVAGEKHEHTAAEKRQPTLVDVYSPAGARLFGTRIRADRAVNEVRAQPNGKGVVLVTVSAAQPLHDHKLAVLRADGAVVEIPHRFGILQKVGIVGAGDAAFVQGTSAWGLVDLTSARVLWQRPGKIRQISPYGAALDALNGRLFLMTGTLEDANTLSYRWTLSVHSAADGKPLGQLTFPRPYPSTPYPVFLRITADALQVLAGRERLTIRLAAR